MGGDDLPSYQHHNAIDPNISNCSQKIFKDNERSQTHVRALHTRICSNAGPNNLPHTSSLFYKIFHPELFTKSRTGTLSKSCNISMEDAVFGDDLFSVRRHPFLYPMCQRSGDSINLLLVRGWTKLSLSSQRQALQNRTQDYLPL